MNLILFQTELSPLVSNSYEYIITAQSSLDIISHNQVMIEKGPTSPYKKVLALVFAVVALNDIDVRKFTDSTFPAPDGN